MAVVSSADAVVVAWELSNEDGDDNENGNKPIGLDWQKNNLARGSHFFVHSFADYDVKMSI